MSDDASDDARPRARDRIEIVRGDITTLAVDVIVNAANEELRGGGGVDGAIHRAAGRGLLEELLRYDRHDPGDAVLTGGHALPARWVVHAIGPRWRDGTSGEPATLRRAYDRAFALAREQGARTIAFPAISTGIYGYPKREAATIAVGAMLDHAEHFDRVIACLFDEESERAYREALRSG